ncbi:MAG: ACP S-malonyltransferase, partial [Deltaproteobacteria bacterium]|nr:ACP S-malonyltransferase [Deltaproteobacteria bacterium]
IAELFDLAEQITKLPIKKLCFQGPINELSETKNLQPAILTVSLAAYKLFSAKGVKPSFAAGHSLGEFGALVASGVLTESEALELVAKRAVLMQKNAQEKPGAMSAILNLDEQTILSICELARNEGIVVAANFNTPVQTVISGESRAVAAATRYVTLKGGKALALPVSGAFHSPLMQQAAKDFSEILDGVEFKTPLFPVLPNALGSPVSDPKVLKDILKKQIISPVRWTTTVESLYNAGARRFYECWPRPYIGSLIKKSLPKDSEAVDIQVAK